jgi:ribonuclease HII
MLIDMAGGHLSFVSILCGELSNLCGYMLACYPSSGQIICGCDEAGRGPLAGPVVAAAVILPRNFRHPLLNDSKKLSEAQRNEARQIIEQCALAYGIGILDHEAIDRVNILRASFQAMHLAIDQMSIRPDRIIVDGNRFIPYGDIPFDCIVKGDGKYVEIAAASILAKTHRDQIMNALHEKYSVYNWKQNKGYPTRQHREAIREHGPSPFHRMSFRLLKEEDQSLLDL